MVTMRPRCAVTRLNQMSVLGEFNHCGSALSRWGGQVAISLEQYTHLVQSSDSNNHEIAVVSNSLLLHGIVSLMHSHSGQVSVSNGQVSGYVTR